MTGTVQHDPAPNPSDSVTTKVTADGSGAATGWLQVTHLSVSYGQREVLRDINLTIPPRQITAIMGSSGVGKSTFLSALNRLTDLEPRCRLEGQILLDGCSTLDPDCDLQVLRRRVGMVFQRPNPFPLSIRRNLLLPMRDAGLKTSEAEARMEQVLRETGLWTEVADRLNQSALTLSGGQQQRLCLARALALRPEILLCDEPCSALDPRSSQTVEELLAKLSRTITIVIVTHNLAQARRLADQAAVFWFRNGAGCVIDSGPAERLFQQPVDPELEAWFAGRVG